MNRRVEAKCEGCGAVAWLDTLSPDTTGPDWFLLTFKAEKPAFGGQRSYQIAQQHEATNLEFCSIQCAVTRMERELRSVPGYMRPKPKEASE